jgi:hypothetical protein
LVAPDSGLTLGREVSADTTLIVVGTARVGATVRGDLLVLGDLYLRPGGSVAGDAVAIGGRVMESTLARVGGRMLAYERIAFVARDDGDGTLALRARPLDGDRPESIVWPGVRGLRIPAYDRINGLSVAVGPEVRLDTGRVRLEPTVTYRSHLGEFDPALRARAEFTRRTSIELELARGTFSNDAWIRNEIVNGALALAFGFDTRNWYRADRGIATVGRRYESTIHVLEPFVGAQLERAWSVGRDSGAASAPYAVLGRNDPEGIRRFNPVVTGGRIASLLAGARWRVEGETSQGDATLQLEQALDVARGSRFTQATLDAQAALPGFRDHRLAIFAHAVGTVGGAVPSQRYAYVGGGGTIPSLFLLEQGGRPAGVGRDALHRAVQPRHPPVRGIPERDAAPHRGRGGGGPPAGAHAEPRAPPERGDAARRLHLRPERPRAEQLLRRRRRALSGAGASQSGRRSGTGSGSSATPSATSPMSCGPRTCATSVSSSGPGRLGKISEATMELASSPAITPSETPIGSGSGRRAAILAPTKARTGGEAEPQEVELLDHAREQEEQRPQPQDGEDVRRVDDERVARDAEDRRDRVDGEHEVGASRPARAPRTAASRSSRTVPSGPGLAHEEVLPAVALVHRREAPTRRSTGLCSGSISSPPFTAILIPVYTRKAPKT